MSTGILTASQRVAQQRHDRHREQCRAWRAANTEKCRTYGIAWRAAHPDYHRDWRRANPDYQRAWKALRAAEVTS